MAPCSPVAYTIYKTLDIAYSWYFHLPQNPMKNQTMYKCLNLENSSQVWRLNPGSLHRAQEIVLFESSRHLEIVILCMRTDGFFYLWSLFTWDCNLFCVIHNVQVLI